MSRHRIIRNLDLSEEYDDDDHNTDQLTDEQIDLMAKGYAAVREVFPEDTGITRKEIEDSLWYYYFDPTETVKWLLRTKKSSDPPANKKSGNIPKETQPKPNSKSPSTPKAATRTGALQGPSDLRPKLQTAKPPGTLPAPVAAVHAKAAEAERKRMILASEEESTRNKNQQNFDGEFLQGEDQNVQDDDAQLRFDISALNLEPVVPFPTEKKTQLPKTPPLETTCPPPTFPSVEKSTPKSSPKFRKINVIEEYSKRSAEQDNLNLVVIGHVDAGKSTLMGHLLYRLGHVADRDMRKYERDSSKIGKSSFAYAWVLDETGEERSRGITMDVAIRRFATSKHSFTLLDAPGHRDFIPNMISGAAQADVALLVVDSATGEFEAGFEADGQTKEHALLVRSLGVRQMAVVVNKMDTCGWSQARYDEIVAKLSAFLVSAGLKKSNTTFVPCSGMAGDNLIKKSDDVSCSWYGGPTLVEVLDSFAPPVRPIHLPFRLSVSDFFKGGFGAGSGGTVSVGGRIDAGHVQVGETVVVVPGNVTAVVKSVSVNEELTRWAAAGDSVLLTLSGVELQHLSIGAVLCLPGNLVPLTNHFLAQIVVFDVKIPITIGYPIVLHQQSMNEPGYISNLVAIVDKVTGEATKRNPRHLPKLTTARVEIKTSRAICLEPFLTSKELGRILLRKGGETIATGIVLEVFSSS